MRASEDQGTEMAIRLNSFDTKFPSNINEADLSPEMTQSPLEQAGFSDCTIARVSAAGVTNIAQQMMARSAVNDGIAGVMDQSRLLNEITRRVERDYLDTVPDQHSRLVAMAVKCARLVMAKLTVIVFLPILFTADTASLTTEIRNRLLIAAIEVAEYNHALNTEVPQFRWIYQTHTQWHCIIYLLMEITRRPYSPLMERAWSALHSGWLIPPEAFTEEKNPRIWLPLRKLIKKAGKYRAVELIRLRADRQAAETLAMDDLALPVPSSSASSSDVDSATMFRQRWISMISAPQTVDNFIGNTGFGTTSSDLHNDSFSKHAPSVRLDRAKALAGSPPYVSGPQGLPANAQINANVRNSPAALTLQHSDPTLSSQQHSQINDSQSPPQGIWPTSQPTDNPMPGMGPWLWADLDPTTLDYGNLQMPNIESDPGFSSDLDNMDFNWYNWVESAQNMG
jgi:hypothetical protein